MNSAHQGRWLAVLLLAAMAVPRGASAREATAGREVLEVREHFS
jgi:hypothetical protein